jgi:hypothetical protein
MDICPVCGAEVGFFEGDPMRRCNSCIKANRYPEGHPKANLEPVRVAVETEVDNQAPSQFQFFTSASRVFAWIAFLATIVVSFLIFARPDVILGTAVLVSGVSGSLLLGVLSDISRSVSTLARHSENSERKSFAPSSEVKTSQIEKDL